MTLREFFCERRKKKTGHYEKPNSTEIGEWCCLVSLSLTVATVGDSTTQEYNLHDQYFKVIKLFSLSLYPGKAQVRTSYSWGGVQAYVGRIS